MCEVALGTLQERTRDWQARFGGALGLTCRELTGDSEDIANLDGADIICITPEKFDALTRKHKDQGGMRFFGEVLLGLGRLKHVRTPSVACCIPCKAADTVLVHCRLGLCSLMKCTCLARTEELRSRLAAFRASALLLRHTACST